MAPPARTPSVRYDVTQPAGAGPTTAGDWRLALCVLAAATFLRLALAAVIPLFPDETYYWEWSRHLAAGYFDHPAGIALAIAASTWLTPHLGIGLSPVAVRFVVIAMGFGASLAGAALARRIAGDRAGLIAAAVFCAMPLAAAGLVLATPDVPLLFTAGIGLYCVVRALESPAGSNRSRGWWLAAGVALGGAFASKYTSILLPVGVTLAVATRPALRARLREAGPYLACVAATLVFVPVLLWNAHHDWNSFVYQMHHGLGAARGSFAKRELDLLGGQAGLATPILFVLMAMAVWRALRAPRSDAHYLLAVVTLTCAGTFVLSALRRPVEANWPAVAYIAAVPLLAIADWTAVARRWLTWGVWLAVAVSALAYTQAVVPFLPLPARRDPIARSAGWGALANIVDMTRNGLAADSVHVWIGADRYQDASELAFHLPDHPLTFSMNLGGRANQYDFWPDFPSRAHAGDDLVLALDEGAEPHPTAVRLGPHFESLERGSLVSIARRDDDVITQRRIWILRHWNGTWPQRP